MIYSVRKILIAAVFLIMTVNQSVAQHSLMQLSVRFPGKEMDGMLLIKDLDSAFRYIVLAKTGLKIADVTIQKRNFHYSYRYLLPGLEKRKIKPLLATSFYLFGYPESDTLYNKRKIKVKSKSGEKIVFVYDEQGTLRKKRGFGLFNARVRVFYRKKEIVIKRFPVGMRIWK